MIYLCKDITMIVGGISLIYFMKRIKIMRNKQDDVYYYYNDFNKNGLKRVVLRERSIEESHTRFFMAILVK